MNSIPRQLLLQLILILFNAFFAMTEIAVISLNSAKLKKLIDDGDKKAAKLLRLVEQPTGFLSTIQIGITLASLLGSAFAADSFSDGLVDWIYNGLGFHALSPATLNTIAVIIITIILSYFTLILGELVPKRIAMQKPYQVAKFAYGVVSVVMVIMKPVVWFLSISTTGVLKIFRIKNEVVEETVTEDEIRMMADIGEEKGTIDSEERELIDNVFEFGDTIVRESMTGVTDIVAFSLRDSTEQIEETIRTSGLSRFPVYDEDIDDIVGVLNSRDFLLARAGCKEPDIRSMLRPAYFVPETIKISVLFKDMQKKKTHLALVVGEFGETSGLVTMEDLIEELVGNIYDEFDPYEVPEIEKISDNLWRASGSVSVDTVARELDIDIPEDAEYDTLGGMVLSCLHTIPVDGTQIQVEVNGLLVRVEQIEGRRIREATISKIEKDDEEEEKDKDKDNDKDKDKDRDRDREQEE